MQHLISVLGEGWRAARSQKGTSALVFALVAGTCLGVLLTVGRTVAAEESVLTRIDEAGTRSIIARATGDEPFPASVIDILAATEQVADVTGLGPIADSHNTLVPGGPPVPVRRAYGTLGGQPLVPAVTGLSEPMGLVSEQGAAALGLIDGSGGLRDAEDNGISVRTALHLPDHLAHLEPVVLIPASLPRRPSGREKDAPLTQILVIADSPQDVDAVADMVTDLLVRPGGGPVAIETSTALAEIRLAIGGRLGTFGRSTILGVLGISIVLIASALIALMNGRRKDFGRSRALGAGRTLIVALVLLQITMPAVAGAITGTAAGIITVHLQGQPAPGWSFASALALATVLSALIAAILPALIAAHREPLHELRVP